MPAMDQERPADPPEYRQTLSHGSAAEVSGVSPHIVESAGEQHDADRDDPLVAR